MLNEVLSILIAYLGVFVGLGLSRIAKEEVLAGKKNLIVLEHTMRLLIIVLFFLTLDVLWIERLVIFIALFVIAMFLKNNYYLFGLMLGMNPTFLMSSLVFIYGFPLGSLLHKKTAKSLFKKTALFILFGLIGLFVNSKLI